MPKIGKSIGAFVCVLAAALTASCDSGTSGPGPIPTQSAGIRIVAQPQSDTVAAAPTQAVVVEIRNAAGDLAPNVTVRFEPTFTNDNTQPTMHVGGLGSSGVSSFYAGVTDQNGRIAARVVMGIKVVPAGVVITVPEFGYADTAVFSIRAGAAAAIRVTPSDTALLIGGSYSPTAVVTDYWGNPRSEATTISTVAGPVSLSGKLVTGTAFGRASLIARSGAIADTFRVSVVPAGTIAAFGFDATQQIGVYLLNLDGSALRRVVTSERSPGYNGDMAVAWNGDRTRLVYHDATGDHSRKLFVVDLSSGQTQRLLPAASQMEYEGWPKASHDGQWIYFNGGSSARQDAYRVRFDGSALQKLPFAVSLDPAPSPDGTRVVSVNANAILQVLTLSTGEVVSLGVEGLMPTWSPDGAEILYVATWDTWARYGKLRAVRPDGTGDRAVMTTNVNLRWTFSFSPDGRYIIARESEQPFLHVIDYATGVSVPVRYTSFGSGLFAPAWK